MSSDGGVGHTADDTTSFVLQPPQQRAPGPGPDPSAGRLLTGRYRLLGKLAHFSGDGGAVEVCEASRGFTFHRRAA
ncbi:hypothetical protein [Streptomyces sp. MMG1121]|uniref:hypothetical protein n=1 Tax=Streptomyces sp. MMG1121 TaxID=1415544 RepID=UPI0006AE5B9A|nr:hypothetical protein [Streptomyces sp. MMG1121]KOV67168.1 hypothetical protein ADK64_09960 [Streptomyces sp. MMG1121]